MFHCKLLIACICLRFAYSQADLSSFWKAISLPQNEKLIKDGNNCHHEPGNIPGRCLPFASCPIAMEILFKNGQMPTKCQPLVDGDYSNIVCCPDNVASLRTYSTTTTTTTQPSTTTSTTSTTTTTTTTTTTSKPIIAPKTAFLTATPLRISEKECVKMYNIRSDYLFQSDDSNNRNINRTLPIQRPKFNLFEDFAKRFHIKVVSGIIVEDHEYPFMCALGWTKSDRSDETVYNCGCVLISPRFILTAAHCTALGGTPPSIARIGSKYLNDSFGEEINIDLIILHPKYEANSIYNDIAIIKLKHDCRHKPACLWHQRDPTLKRLTALGYGQTSFAGPMADSLLKIFLKTVPREQCYNYYLQERHLRGGLDDGQLCARDPDFKMDTCQGDSGGPLLLYEFKHGKSIPYILGLTSFGIGCANGVPSIYTRISHFLDWIESNVWQ